MCYWDLAEEVANHRYRCIRIDDLESAALTLLRAANLIATVWRGREKLHYLNPLPIHQMYDRWINKFEHHQLRALDELKKRLEEEKHG